jgi:hypothetical protein
MSGVRAYDSEDGRPYWVLCVGFNVFRGGARGSDGCDDDLSMRFA